MAYQKSKSPVLKAYEKLGGNGFGRWLVSKVVCFKAPYFSSIKPVFTQLEPGHVEIKFKKRRSVTNHLGTVHAIAMCNAAEFVGGICLESSLTASMRWIPVGMTVQYLKMAKTDLRAVCKIDYYQWEEEQDVVMPVDVIDTEGNVVFHADISMRISQKKSA